MPITVQVIDVIKNINSAQVGPSSPWALVLCTCCTIHCYATASCYLIPRAAFLVDQSYKSRGFLEGATTHSWLSAALSE